MRAGLLLALEPIALVLKVGGAHGVLSSDRLDHLLLVFLLVVLIAVSEVQRLRIGLGCLVCRKLRGEGV